MTSAVPRVARALAAELHSVEREIARVRDAPDLGPLRRHAVLETLGRQRTVLVEKVYRDEDARAEYAALIKEVPIA